MMGIICLIIFACAFGLIILSVTHKNLSKKQMKVVKIIAWSLLLMLVILVVVILMHSPKTNTLQTNMTDDSWMFLQMLP